MLPVPMVAQAVDHPLEIQPKLSNPSVLKTHMALRPLAAASLRDQPQHLPTMAAQDHRVPQALTAVHRRAAEDSLRSTTLKVLKQAALMVALLCRQSPPVHPMEALRGNKTSF